jgi:L-threonylcarbamoyladenylate synthase
MPFISPTEAIQRLLQEEVVALPTETVYGLAANIQSTRAIEKIFITKSRPFFDPLIVHVENKSKAQALITDWSELHEKLADTFWPGPLTILGKKTPTLNPMITSGSPCVAVRVPQHPDFLQILKTFSGLAAPSANMFGKTSPTKAEHVLSEFSGKVAVVDGGPCAVGIESTIVEINSSSELTILRPGVITAEALKKCLNEGYPGVRITYQASETVPGHLKYHYQPEVPLCVHTPAISEQQALNELEKATGKKFSKPYILILPGEATVCARMLYDSFRQGSIQGDCILCTIPVMRTESDESWTGILNRVEKAASLFLKE